MPTQTLTLKINGIQKTVIDYGGSLVGLPAAVEALESAVDKAAGTERWVKGNADTKASLQAEHWSFASSSQDNIRLFDTVIRKGDGELIKMFLAAKAPTVTSDPQLLSPLCVASSAGNLDLVEHMLSKQPHDAKLSEDVLDECLAGAAGSGDLSLVEFWVDHGARPRWHKHGDALWGKFTPPLLRAIDSKNPDVLALLLRYHPDLSASSNENQPLIIYVLDHTSWGEDSTPARQMLSLLIDAGADVNESSQNQPPALFHVSLTPDAIPLLVAAGADVNARSRDGQTPLMRSCFVKQTVQALLAAGADPTLKDQHGETAADQARRFGCKDCADLLEQAMKSHLAGQ